MKYLIFAFHKYHEISHICHDSAMTLKNLLDTCMLISSIARNTVKVLKPTGAHLISDLPEGAYKRGGLIHKIK